MHKSIVKFLILISVCLVLFGTGILTKVWMDNKIEEKEDMEAVAEFEDSVKEEVSSSSDGVTLQENVLGVLYIPSYDDFKHVIGSGVDRETLNTYVGMYKDYASIGEEGNTVLASHSSPYPGKHIHCYFNRIEDAVKKGDAVNVLWHDGKMYHYKITDIYTWIPESEEEKYLSDNDGKQYVILQTCTHGDGKYRTFIKCIRTDE